MKDLPTFQPRDADAVREFISMIFTRPPREETYLLDLIAYDDGHYRASFAGDYFVIQPGQDAPSKSQWNTLKKKLKRHDPLVFVFKEHGRIEPPPGGPDGPGYYLDFGFFAA